VILGTLAVTQPEIVTDLIARHGADRIAVALDARDGFIATHGWQKSSAVTPVELGKRFAAAGARHALYTNVGREGTLGGVDASGTAELARQTGLAVIASGGVNGLMDVRSLVQTGAVSGVVLGTALYEGKLAFPDALKIASGAG
jgi:phosphoribosylformimino-5-aminoimidazole carboxamide ribotide isomerase